MKTTVVGMLVMTAMAAAMGSAFAQEAAKAAPTLTAEEKEQAKKIYFERWTRPFPARKTHDNGGVFWPRTQPPF